MFIFKFIKLITRVNSEKALGPSSLAEGVSPAEGVEAGAGKAGIAGWGVQSLFAMFL